jgi:hypothetical protein
LEKARAAKHGLFILGVLLLGCNQQRKLLLHRKRGVSWEDFSGVAINRIFKRVINGMLCALY